MKMHVDFPEDCDRIARVLSMRGFPVTVEQAGVLWANYSQDEYCATFMMLPAADTTIFDNLVRYMLKRLAQ